MLKNGLLLWIGMAVFTGLSASAQTIKMGTVVPEGSPWHEALLEMGQKWREISNGSVILRIYPGGVAGDEPDLIRKVRIGQLHATALTSTGFIGINPDIEALTFPTLIRTDEELDYVLDKMAPVFEKQLAEKGFKVLNWSSAGWVHFFSRQPVRSAADLRKQKLFFWGSDTTYVELLKSLGFQPVPLAVTDLMPSLQTGLVDAFAAPPAAALSFQWFGLAQNMADFRWQPLVGTTVVSTRMWDRIPADLRPELERAAREVGLAFRAKNRQLGVDAVDVMKKHGLTVHAVSPEATEEFYRLVAEKGLPVFVGPRFSKSIYEQVQAALNEFRAPAPASGTAP